ncbi:hypothetical protein [Nitrosomonas sp. Is37]|uniref:hypothetical protein n=1 Tax=Nitrosomonas sp. Is37 TaxID=3080535 RepID=UPI00294B6E3F|nr:hypothetical protein [Nitrosomonas sp. Is37]MDV6345033.1 hypothetical protein [Nitrosomonas sp. Is37]
MQDIVDEDYDQYEGVAVPLFLELGAKRSGIEERAFPEFRDHREVMSQVYSELVRKGLLNHKQINDPLDSVISPLGKQFLNFIRFPDEPKKVDA